MVKAVKFLLIITTLLFSSVVFSTDFEEALNTIEVRKTAMQSLWYRIKRISPYVELKEKVDYNKDLATEDAKEIIILLKKAKNLWPDNSNLSAKGFTNATPAVWALPEYFGKLYTEAEESAYKLKNSVIEDNIEYTTEAMCNLGKACGTCHANFRRLMTSQLSNEVSGWSGQYIKNCNSVTVN